MSALLAKASRQGFLQAKTSISSQGACISTGRRFSRKKIALAVAGGVLGVGSVGVGMALLRPANAQELILHPPHYRWDFKGYFAAYDKASVRRGYQVYKQVCAACHTMEALCYRHLVDVCYSEREAKREAEEAMVWDGPNDAGQMFQRPGKLSDPFPKPYDNVEAAKAANNGAYPPDLGHVVLAREEAESYIFALLTGYCDPPAGYELADGMAYNPYFAGGAISMAQALYNEIIEYEDGTPATQSQLAKDVVTFLSWASDPDLEQRKKFGIKAGVVLFLMTPVAFYYKRFKFHTLYTQQIFWKKGK
ncbi:cytochrome c1, heme protein, mitochondrial-like [Lingula anatina]|uniref:Cytochrome c1, heme protein, mitochondrial-like n=1 Tax=Lingula anatina TaxID=7574 RepID=A0A1S3K7N3_LINAN|nr:cytochrome c1, heme protein, mitochondrial-like [Lingula anatina]|eukprot:XP_013418454.1 cytochrome c1, heme protein, mitochondrial-like [Lingula anatina]